jgi:hypothetical protein
MGHHLGSRFFGGQNTRSCSTLLGEWSIRVGLAAGHDVDQRFGAALRGATEKSRPFERVLACPRKGPASTPAAQSPSLIFCTAG